MRVQWCKSSYSKVSGDCVEVTHFTSGEGGIRDSKQPELGYLSFSSAEWSTFVSALSSRGSVKLV
ncbi:DUF397 domain-containing protein [Nocardiopsis alkaliphila]|uniref:DUF397 domain-containing protein n=1 Tax=Nocardiopsis alkaliphila TaxID=225762 RepID=UPI000476FCE6|nr:DUF397 domain-containing protein [Nocardiopsis alkaliphila]